ncbi:hypothetical protein [Pedobacter chitinilyticus]|uniref:Uncharacterized protein n=1 Tax=Pedobacter chitinilyticus TaxID=2233776 RepID=A0A443YW70_9SPHI|nr:hypothetical protein [Pedobacter chitinilyticus]RWU08178.1 hypothetical protein DPV69_07290 [Pedobacter chitinilyticus]
MGQYYKAVNLDRQEFVSPYTYHSGAKLMEHSWLYSPMVNAVVTAIAPAGTWHGCRLVWAGDYMDEQLFLKGLGKRARSFKTLYDCCQSPDETDTPCIAPAQLKITDGPAGAYLANHDKKQQVALSDLPEEDPNEKGWHIHPLPLLCCSGNGRGGGDFRGENPYTGSWAGDRISAEYGPLEGYQLIVPAFTEQQDNHER